MKVYRDLTYVKQRKRRATLLSILGVALLGSAFWLASTTGQNGILIAYIPLLAGTTLAGRRASGSTATAAVPRAGTYILRARIAALLPRSCRFPRAGIGAGE